MKKLLLTLLAGLGLLSLLPHSAAAAQCGLPDSKPLWLDYAEGTVGFRQEIFGRPGVIAATSGRFVPPDLRKRGAQTVYWEMRLGAQVGSTLKPRDPEEIPKVAGDLFEKAVASSGCTQPWIALNELHGAGTTTPWTDNNAQYRANVLALVQELSRRGARPFLLISSTPYTGGDAAEWWRQAAQAADLVPEVYFNARSISGAGALVGSRRVRQAFRRAIGNFTQIGVPVERLGVMLGFQSGPGFGGREGLEPSRRWFEYVKLQALAARQVAGELQLPTVWSWGWGTLSAAGADVDKAAAACVYLWVRDQGLCDGPGMAGPEFDTSLSIGQAALPDGVQCTVGASPITNNQVAELTEVTGDREVARTILLARLAEAGTADVSTAEILAAERTLIFQHFRGSRGLYIAALGRARATLSAARGAIADQLRRAKIGATLPAPAPSAAAVQEFYDSYPEVPVRSVQAKPAPSWLGKRASGIALASIAPAQVFGMKRAATVRSAEGVFTVKPLGERMPLGSVPLAVVRGAIAATLTGYARDEAYDAWTTARQTRALATTTCVGDQLPEVAPVELIDYLGFLRLD